MSITAARSYLSERGYADKVQEFSVSSATVALAAEALHCEPARIAKTLAFLVGEENILIVAAGDIRIDNARYKAQFHSKAKMIPIEELNDRVGHEIGGVCPFGIREGVKVYLDESLKRFHTVFPACGSANSAIELTIPELEQLSGYLAWIDVGKGWRDGETE
ncbi:MAG: YbaK/EbsC family protein [Oscillospiraceae bacterium]|nr:YbaK/EbsC family protein [Oscillospiraceae bacterium]MBR2978144.1 YbaK/EbsC family protein [Oscillospiraceae bacterium]